MLSVLKFFLQKICRVFSEESQFVTWIRQRRRDISNRLGIPKHGSLRETKILDERAASVVQEYGNGIMEKLPLEMYFRYTNIMDIISAVPAPFQLRYNSSGEGDDEGVDGASSSGEEDVAAD